MGTVKGNRGNLLQHWTLCEVLTELSKTVKPDAHLLFVTTHSMSPWSSLQVLVNEADNPTRYQFDRVRTRLSSTQNPSKYEHAWRVLSSRRGSTDGLLYPNSMVLARGLWRGPMSFLACERDQSSSEEIEKWLLAADLVVGHKVEREWRSCFDHGFPSDWAPDAVFIEMDPMRYESRLEVSRSSDALYEEDLVERVSTVIASSPVPTVLQVSSYAVCPGNTQEQIRLSIRSALESAAVSLSGEVMPDGAMVSMVFAKDVSLWPTTSLSERWRAWPGALR